MTALENIDRPIVVEDETSSATSEADVQASALNSYRRLMHGPSYTLAMQEGEHVGAILGYN